MECKHFTSQRAADLERRWEGKGQEKVWCEAEGSLGKRLLSGPIKPQLTAAPPQGSRVMESLPGQKLTPIRGCAGRGFTPTFPCRSRVSSRYGDGPGSSWEQRVDNEGCPGNPSCRDTARPRRSSSSSLPAMDSSHPALLSFEPPNLCEGVTPLKWFLQDIPQISP